VAPEFSHSTGFWQKYGTSARQIWHIRFNVVEDNQRKERCPNSTCTAASAGAANRLKNRAVRETYERTCPVTEKPSINYGGRRRQIPRSEKSCLCADPSKVEQGLTRYSNAVKTVDSLISPPDSLSLNAASSEFAEKLTELRSYERPGSRVQGRSPPTMKPLP